MAATWRRERPATAPRSSRLRASGSRIQEAQPGLNIGCLRVQKWALDTQSTANYGALRTKHRITGNVRAGGGKLRSGFGRRSLATGMTAVAAVVAVACGGSPSTGSTSCDYIASHASGPGTIAMVEGDLTSLNARDRASGCTSMISSKYPNFKVKSYETKDWGTDPAVQNATTALTAISDLRGIYVHWSVPEDGIIAAEKQKSKYSDVGASNHIILVGNDGSPHECDLIRSKTLDATIDQPADKYAYYAIFYAKEAIKGTKYSEGQKTDHNSTIVNVQGNQEDALAAPLVTLAGDNGSTQVTSTDLWCNNH